MRVRAANDALLTNWASWPLSAPAPAAPVLGRAGAEPAWFQRRAAGSRARQSNASLAGRRRAEWQQPKRRPRPPTCKHSRPDDQVVEHGPCVVHRPRDARQHSAAAHQAALHAAGLHRAGRQQVTACSCRRGAEESRAARDSGSGRPAACVSSTRPVPALDTAA
jgi:hypothetical protein